MPGTTQTIGPLIGGVSQAPPHIRPPEYATELVNALAHPKLGMTKRPGTRHRAKLDNSVDGHYGSASIFPFSAGDKRRYFVSISNGVLRVVEADTGIERDVAVAPGALDYFTGLLDDDRAFDAVASGDRLYITNRAKVVAKGTASAPVRPSEALISVRAADFGTTYSVTLDGHQASYRTPDGTDATARSFLSTDTISASLAQLVRNLPGRDAFDITQEGSTIYIRRFDGNPFALTAGDGLADIGLVVCFGTIKAGLDLPPTGVVEGFTVRVQGDPRTAADDYWMTWLDGVWQECARPGSLVSIDPSTMPHTLTLGGALHDGLIVPDPPTPPTASPDAGISIPLAWESGAVAGIVTLSATQVDRSADFLVGPADGLSGRVDVRYSIDASGIQPTDSVDVTLYRVNGDDSLTELATVGHAFSEQVLQNRLLTHTMDYTAGQRLRLTVHVNTVTVDAVATLTTLVTGPDKGEAAGICYTSSSSALVSIPDVTYPGSAVVTVEADGVSVDYTVADSGELGSAIAAAIVDAWPVGDVHIADAGNGTLKLWNTDTGVAPTVTANVDMDTDHTLWIPDGALIPSDLVGLRFLNLTTGASGTVTANTAGTVTSTDLAGGSSTALRSGDFISIAAASDSFSLTRAEWADRQAGDDDSNPFPSFVGRTIGNIGTESGRLVLQPGEYFVGSEAGQFGNFFRTSTQQVLDSDPIDVRSSAGKGLPFLHMVHWNGALHFLNARNINMLSSGQLPLAPRTVSLPFVYEVSIGAACRPVVVGRRLYIARYKNGYTQLLALEAAGEGVGVNSYDTTSEVPLYLVGEPIVMAADAEGPLVIVTEGKLQERYIYAMVPVQVGRGTVFAWTQWAMDSTAFPLAISMEGGDMVLILQRADGVYLESVDTLAHIA